MIDVSPRTKNVGAILMRIFNEDLNAIQFTSTQGWDWVLVKIPENCMFHLTIEMFSSANEPCGWDDMSWLLYIEDGTEDSVIVINRKEAKL